MTDVFIYINLSAGPPVRYRVPLLEWVKQQFPTAASFDLDAASDATLVTYAVRMLQEAERPVVYLCCSEEVPVGPLGPILEEVIISRPKCLVLLHGHHPRLQRMLGARAKLPFLSSLEEEPLQERLVAFWQEAD